MVKDFKFRGRGGVMFRVVKPGKLEAGDRLEIVSTPGHGVSVARWFTYEAPEDARVLLAAQEAGKVRTRRCCHEVRQSGRAPVAL